MSLDLADVHSLNEFQQNLEEHVRKLKESGQPVLLTVDGQAEIVVQSAGAYEKLLEDQELLASLRGIRRGLEQSQRGEGRPMREFLEELAAEHGLSVK